jgi:hypothetical protein
VSIKLSAKRPDEDLNGLLDMTDQALRHPYEPVVAVVLIKPLRAIREFEQDADGETGVFRFVHIEPLLTDDAIAAGRKLLAEARAKRQGGDTLFDVDSGPEKAGPVAERVKDEWLDPNAKDGA